MRNGHLEPINIGKHQVMTGLVVQQLYSKCFSFEAVLDSIISIGGFGIKPANGGDTLAQTVYGFEIASSRYRDKTSRCEDKLLNGMDIVRTKRHSNSRLGGDYHTARVITQVVKLV